MHVRVFATLVLTVIAARVASAQRVQWASKVIEFSSQYDEEESSARQALGPPNVLPTGGDSPMALAVARGDAEGNELMDSAWIRVGYEKPMRIQQIAVAENCGPGAVSAIIAIDTKGEAHLVYTASPAAVQENARMLCVFVPKTPYAVREVEVRLDPTVPGWNEIDAIGIADSRDSIRAEIRLAKNLTFTGPPENLGPNVNTEYADVVDAISPDGNTLYFSRNGYPGNVGGADAGSDIYVSTRQADGTWSVAQNIGAPLNNKGQNFVNSVTPDGNTLLIGNLYDELGEPAGRGISVTHRTATGWSVPEEVEIENWYNNSRFNEFCFSPDGKAILCAAKRDDTYGAKDLYVAFRRDDGTYSEPKNLGPDVNTIGDETGPFLAADGATLYYSTNGISGYGNCDLFVTRRLDETWTHWSPPENLGPQINTPKFDAYYVVPASGDVAYYSSSNNATGGKEPDIFRISLPAGAKPKPVVLVSGRVFNAKTKEPIAAVIKYETLADGNEVGRARSTPTDGAYKIALPSGGNYGFRAEAPGFVSVSENLNTGDVAAYKEVTKDLYLAPIEVGQTIRVNNIFFDFAKAELKEESFVELNRVVRFLGDNPTIEILLAGHTDNVGGVAGNAALSENRVRAVADYLVAHGVKKRRLTMRGFGESKPVASNDTEEGRALNRRVEFTIVKK